MSVCLVFPQLEGVTGSDVKKRKEELNVKETERLSLPKYLTMGTFLPPPSYTVSTQTHLPWMYSTSAATHSSPSAEILTTLPRIPISPPTTNPIPAAGHEGEPSRQNEPVRR